MAAEETLEQLIAEDLHKSAVNDFSNLSATDFAVYKSALQEAEKKRSEAAQQPAKEFHKKITTMSNSEFERYFSELEADRHFAAKR